MIRKLSVLDEAEKRAFIYIIARSGLQRELQITASVCNAPAYAEPFRHLDPGQPRD